jgi:Fe-S cluster assembly protein SufD
MTVALPTRRIEEWKYSDLARALGDPGFGEGSARALMGPAPDIQVFALDDPKCPEWVGAHSGKLGGNVVSAVSLAKAKGGIALRVPKHKQIETLLAVDFVGQGHVRSLLVLEEGASLTLFERCDGKDTRNIGFDIVLGRNAQLNHVRIALSGSAVVVEEVAVTLADNAQYRAHFANFGAKLSRLELVVALEGLGAGVDLSGVSVLSKAHHADITTHVIHKAAQSQSVQLFKKVVGEGGQGVYQGKVTVMQGADGSDSRQTAKALLLGARAEADLKPELEILADDVKCAHGAAVGDLDAESLFYLRARGIPQKEARHLLLHAFLEDAVAGIAAADLRETVRGALSSALDEVSA